MRLAYISKDLGENVTIKDDYTIENKNVPEDFKYIREIQLDVMPDDIKDLEFLMKKLGEQYKIYQYNTMDRKEYDYFAWTSEDKRTTTLSFNVNKSVPQIIIDMNCLLYEIALYKNNGCKVWVKLNDLRALVEKRERDLK
jgi:hypothetical protein